MAGRHLIAGGRARRDSVGYAFGSSSIRPVTMAAVSEKHDQLLAQILSVSDLQCAWILLLYCAAARPNYLLRVVHPGLTARFVAHHDASLRRALSQLVSAPPQMFWDVVSLPFSRGGLGLRSAILTTNAAFWSSWADTLQMIQSRHPSVAGQILHELSHRNTAGFHVASVGAAREELMRLGFEAQSWAWESVTAGRRPAVLDVDRQIGMPLTQCTLSDHG